MLKCDISNSIMHINSSFCSTRPTKCSKEKSKIRTHINSTPFLILN